MWFICVDKLTVCIRHWIHHFQSQAGFTTINQNYKQGHWVERSPLYSDQSMWILLNNNNNNIVEKWAVLEIMLKTDCALGTLVRRWARANSLQSIMQCRSQLFKFHFWCLKTTSYYFNPLSSALIFKNTEIWIYLNFSCLLAIPIQRLNMPMSCKKLNQRDCLIRITIRCQRVKTFQYFTRNKKPLEKSLWIKSKFELYFSSCPVNVPLIILWPCRFILCLSGGVPTPRFGTTAL